MSTSIELKITQVAASNPAQDLDVIVGMLTIPANTNNLQLTDGTNTTTYLNALTQSQEVIVRIVASDTTMQIGVDGTASEEVAFDGAFVPGSLQILQDGDYTVRDVSVYDERLADPWVGVLLSGVASVTPCRLDDTVTIVMTDPHSTVSSVTIGGTALTNIVEVNATTITADLGRGGYGPIDGTADLVVTDSSGARPAFPVTILLPNGHILTKLVQPADFAPGSAVDDEVIQLSPVIFNSVVYNPHVNPDGSIDFDGNEADIPLTLWINDASDSFLPGTTGTVYSPDMISPVITLTGGTTQLQVGGVYTPPTVQVLDNKDGDISGSVVITGSVDVNTAGDYVVNYDAVDAAGNAAVQVQFDVEVVVGVVSTPPVITVTGGTTTMLVDGVYTPPTVTAFDNVDGVIDPSSIVQTGTIDTSVEGTQTVFFDVSNAAGTPAVQVSHTVSLTLPTTSDPDPFVFVDQSDVGKSIYITSNTITVIGTTTDSTIVVSGGEYSLNSGAYTSTSGTAVAGDTVSVRVMSSSEDNSSTSVTLSIGNTSDVFSVVTELLTDNVPDTFTLGADIVDAAPLTVVVRAFPVAGIDSATTYMATGTAEVSSDGMSWGSSFTASSPQTGYVRLTAAAGNSTTVTGGVTVSGISDDLSITTIADNAVVIHSSNLVVIEGKSRTNTVVNNGVSIPITEGSFDPDEVSWVDFQVPGNKVVQSVTYEIPNGWTRLASRENVTVTDSSGVTYDNTYSVLVKTAHTRNYHTIGAVFHYTDSTVDPRSVRIKVGET